MKPDPIIGAFVFPDAWNDLEGFCALLDSFRDWGVTAVLTESENYEPHAIEAVHERGMRFHAGIACFSDHATGFSRLAARPELTPILQTGEKRPQMEWYIGITPTDRKHQEDVLASIDRITSDFEIDGLFLDFVRWPLHWEIELRPGRAAPPDSSFDAATIEAFAQATGLDPSVGTTQEIASRILGQHHEEWIDFKCAVITTFVAEARGTLTSARSGAELGAFLVPDGAIASEAYTGQRLADLLPLVDWIAPMLYHNILLQPPGWVGERLNRIAPQAAGKTLPVIQADANRDPAVAADWGPPMDLDNWRATLAEVAGRSDIAGLVVFPGTSLGETGRGEALRATIVRG